MTLPSFIGIGGERCGSTWLYSLLQQHRQVYVPLKRKELNFFNLHYSKGLEWYESFFPGEKEKTAYKAIGEISPGYLTYPGAEAKMASVPSIKKLIIILRNPVDRVYSHYGHMIRLGGYSKSFDKFITDLPVSVSMGFYATHLERYLQYFEKQQICCLIFEHSVTDVTSTKKKISQFLNLDFQAFPEEAGLNKVNETYIPKFKRLNRLVSSTGSRLRKADLDWLVNFVKVIGLPKVLKAKASSLPPMSHETRLQLQDTYTPEIEKLEKLMDLNLELWRSPSSNQ
ncbi:MAG: hypothetical protein GVY04_09240 [Cyanobacteria bacterium]|jgi:hypothetical protein|nr:hypothetical protein [Cyanobacteria bacterium GSL.Bin1]